MNSKIMLVSIAVLAVGLFAMPSTVSLISGQHQFIAYDKTSDLTACATCHPEVTVTGVHGNGTTYVNLSNGTGYTNYSRDWNVSRWLGVAGYTEYKATNDKGATCRGCHVPGQVNTSLRIPLNSNGSNLANISNATAHIAVRARCTNCHDLTADSFNSTGVEAHRPLNEGTVAASGSNITFISGNDRACIVCHTWAGISGANFGAALAEKGNFNTTVSRYTNGSWNVTYS